MIHYQLRCDDGHEFEGWFRNSASFESQAESGLLSCPRCGITGIGRGLMAPAVRTRRAALPAAAAAPGPPSPPAVVDPSARQVQPIPDEMRAMLQKLRSEVERQCDNMGDRFADEAIRMSRGEVATRGIYGNATETDRDALADEGIEITQIPWLNPADG